MKIVLRVSFILYAAIVFGLGVYIYIIDLQGHNIWSRVKNNPIFLIPLLWIFLSLPSLIFNFEKLLRLPKKSKSYPVTRIIDLIFSVVMMVVSVLFAIGYSAFLYTTTNTDFNIGELVLPYLLLTVSLALSILLLIDNLRFHKSYEIISIDDSINQIGK